MASNLRADMSYEEVIVVITEELEYMYDFIERNIIWNLDLTEQKQAAGELLNESLREVIMNAKIC